LSSIQNVIKGLIIGSITGVTANLIQIQTTLTEPTVILSPGLPLVTQAHSLAPIQMAQEAISTQDSYNIQQSLLKIKRLEKDKAAAYLKINSLKEMTSKIALEAENIKNSTAKIQTANKNAVIKSPYVIERPTGFNEPFSLFALSVFSASIENKHKYEIKKLNNEKIRVDELRKKQEKEVEKLQQRLAKINKEKEIARIAEDKKKLEMARMAEERKQLEITRITEERKQLEITRIAEEEKKLKIAKLTKKLAQEKELIKKEAEAQAQKEFDAQQLAAQIAEEQSDVNADMIPLYDIMIKHQIDKDPKMLSPAVLKDMLIQLVGVTNAIATSKDNVALYKDFKYTDGDDSDNVHIYFSAEVSHNATLYEFYKPYADLLEEALVRGSYRDLDVHLLPSSN
jgi:hypothetical protein